MDLKEEILSCFQENSLIVRNDLIDILCFDYLTAEEYIPLLIKTCNSTDTSRYDLIDYLKELMIDLLAESELCDKDKELRELLELEIELIQIEKLTKRLDLENKRLILFQISKKYPDLFVIIYSKANFIVDESMMQSLEMVCSQRGMTYEKCFNSR